jgi:hypothetical protein
LVAIGGDEMSEVGELKGWWYLLMMALPMIAMYGIFLIHFWWTHRKGAERDEQ